MLFILEGAGEREILVDSVLTSTAAVLLLVVLGGVVEESMVDKDGVVLVDADCVDTVVRETGDDEVVLPSACIEEVVLFILEGAGEREIVVDAVLTSTAVLLLVVPGGVVEESVYDKDGVVLVDADCVGTVVRETFDDEVVLPSA